MSPVYSVTYVAGQDQPILLPARGEKEARAAHAVYTVARADYAKAQSNRGTTGNIMAGETKALAQFSAGLRYEDFLPISAAGIFASNLGQYGTKSTAAAKPEPPARVLLTGASGALGRVLTRSLSAEGFSLQLTDVAPFPDAFPPARPSPRQT